MENFDIKNIFSVPGILKLVELFFAFISLLLHRCGEKGDPVLSSPHIDGFWFSCFTVTSFFFIILVQLIGIMAEEKAPCQNVTIAIFGFFFYVASGSLVIDNTYVTSSIRYATGSMEILTSFVFLVEACLTSLEIMK